MINRTNKIFIFTIIVILFNCFVTGCNSSKDNEGVNKVQEREINSQTRETRPQPTNSIDTIQATSSGVLNEKSENSLEKTLPIASSSSLESWVGGYTFSEFVPPDENKLYTVSIYKENGNYYANISIDGFQTIERLRAKVNGDANYINLVFDKYLPDNLFGSYNVGDGLVTFKKTNTDINTYWGKITPIDEINKERGICFSKIESSEGYVGHWYTSIPYTGGNSTTIDIKEMSNSSVSFHLYFCRTYYYDAININLENNIAKFVDNGDYKTSGTIEFVNKSIIVNIDKTELPILKTGKTFFNYKVSEFKPVDTTPYSGATDVDLDKGIEIDFGRKIYNTANGICASLTKPNEPIGLRDGYIILDGEIKDNKLVFIPSSEFIKTMKLKIDAGQKYEFRISEGQLRDEVGNINSEINLEFTMK